MTKIENEWKECPLCGGLKKDISNTKIGKDLDNYITKNRKYEIIKINNKKEIDKILSNKIKEIFEEVKQIIECSSTIAIQLPDEDMMFF